MADLKFKGFIFPESNDKEKFSTIPLDKLPLTMTYTPMQSFGNIYSEQDALTRGTLFCDLDKPFYGKFTGANR